MPKDRTIKVYQFDELGESAKERAREWYRQGNDGDNYWSEGVIDDAAKIAEYMGIDINQTPVKLMSGETRYKPTVYYSGFWSQGDGACFEGKWRARDVQVNKLKEYAPQDKELHRIVDGLAEIAKEYPDGYFSVRHRGHYSHSGCTSFDVELPNAQEDELEYDSPEYKVLQVKIGEDEETLIQLARDLMDWIYRQLEKEWDYQNSDEQVDESIRAMDIIATIKHNDPEIAERVSLGIVAEDGGFAIRTATGEDAGQYRWTTEGEAKAAIAHLWSASAWDLQWEI